MTEHRIVIENGQVRAIYSDELLPYIESVMAELGLPRSALTLMRASHVEHAAGEDGANWSADMRPLGGPMVYRDEKGEPFIRRSEAIAYELRWLDKHWLGKEGLQDASTLKEEERIDCDQR